MKDTVINGAICMRLVKIEVEGQAGWFTEENSSFLRNERSQWWMQLWSETEKSWRVRREAPMAMSYQQHWEDDTEANRQNATQSHNSTNCRGCIICTIRTQKGLHWQGYQHSNVSLHGQMFVFVCVFLSHFDKTGTDNEGLCIGFMHEYCWSEYARNKFKFVFNCIKW